MHNIDSQSELKKPRKHKAFIASALATALTGSIVVSMLASTAFAQGFDGDFDRDADQYSVWDGVSYDFSWYEAGQANNEYTISTAAQFAALGIITNDISGDEYAEIRSHIATSDSQYIAMALDFSGATINLNSDIDLGGYDVLPISYPWKTANLTSTYDIVKPDGTITHYIALEDVPDVTPVDPWVGDGNGNMISTRYWEYPESEMRFRDLLYAVNFEGEVNQRVEHNVNIENFSYTDNYLRYSALPARILAANYSGSWTGNTEFKYIDGGPGTGNLGENTILEHNGMYENAIDERPIDWSMTVSKPTLQFVEMKLHDSMPGHLNEKYIKTFSDIITLDENRIVASYAYKDIKDYTENIGFSGTFNGQDHRVKNFTPNTPWTEDTTERLTTYDPISKGLFGMISENSIVKNLNVSGSYDTDDIVSYSGILCGYNYGTIENCWIDGNMEQGLITQIYPIRRDYSPNKDSTYVLSDTAGTILPVGHSGFVTAVNNGTIKDCTTSGAVTQAYRMFGFAACTNNGTIENFNNKASFDTYDVNLDFTTDEWTNKDNYVHEMNLQNWTTYYPIRILNSQWANYRDMDAFNFGLNGVSEGSTLEELLTQSAAYRNLLTNTGRPYVAPLYNTEAYESIAANHIYGVYGYTAVGGVCAENNGLISNSTNNGQITAMKNTSSRLESEVYDICPENANKQDYYSYIRPYSSYGLFSTQSNAVVLASGIAAFNNGEINTVTNNADINTIQTDISNLNGDINLIPYTGNGYYANDCVIYENRPETEFLYYPLGFAYWMNSETESRVYSGMIGMDITTGLSSEVKQMKVDMWGYEGLYKENMPYPMTHGDDHRYVWKYGDSNYYWSNWDKVEKVSHINSYNAGITTFNTGIIDTATNNGNAISNIVLISDTNKYSDITPKISNIESNADAVLGLGLIIRDTDTENVNINNSSADTYSTAGYILSKTRNTTLNNTNVYKGNGLYYITHGTPEAKVNITNTFIYDDTGDGYGCADISDYTTWTNVYNFQKSDSGVSHEMTKCNLENVYMYGEVAYDGIGSGTIDEYIKNVNFYGIVNNFIIEDIIFDDHVQHNNVEVDGYAIGKLSSGKYDGLHVASYEDNGEIAWTKYIADITDAEVNNLSSFVNVKDTALQFKNCNVNGVSVVGKTINNLPENKYWYLVDHSNCEDMLLQLDIDFEWTNPFKDFTRQNVPGVLKVFTDTNTFTDVVVQTPNGAVSYDTLNFMLEDDESIKSDAKLSYDENSRESGAMAYYRDHGQFENRTYDYTVATSDTEDILANIENLVEMDKVNITSRVVNYPSYTRKIKNISERPYYRFNVPFTSNGAGELIASVERDDYVYKTKAENEIFPVTDLFAQEGDRISLEKIEHSGYELAGITRASKSGTTEIASDGSALDDYIHSLEIMPEEDVSLITTWSDVYEIEVETDDYVTITTNCDSAAKGRRVYVNTLLSSDDVVIDKVMYYNYKLDSSNRLVLDYNNPVEIPVEDMYFTMPANNVRIFVTTLGNKAAIDEFILANSKATINPNTKTITVNLDASTDLSNIAPDKISISGNATLFPDAETKLDFTKNVEYTLTTESGQKITYKVVVNPRVDGQITKFEVLGKQASINQETGIISLTFLDSIDLSNVTPYIVWSGSAISNEGAIDLTNGSTYIVTSSSGVDRTYTVEIERFTGTESLVDFNISIPGVTNPIWTKDNTTKTISCTVPYGTDLYDCEITALNWYGITSNMAVGDHINLTKSNYLTIRNDDGSDVTYSIVAREDPSTAKVVNQFVLFGYEGVIEGTNITVTLPSKYDITNIMPDIINFTGKAISEDIYARQDFTKPVTFTVEAYDETSIEYTVSVVQN